MRIGLFGGSFNPPHCHHLKIARAARACLKLDEVWFVPVYQPVHKPDRELLSFDLRRQLLREALRQEPELKAVDLEKTLGGASYTYRLVEHLHHHQPNDQFWLIIGSDSLLDLPNWKNYPQLLRDIPLAVVERPGFSRHSAAHIPGTITWVPVPGNAISSSEIRRRLAQGRLKGLPVPACLFPRLIRENVLNCCGDQYGQWLRHIRKFSRKSPKGLRRHMDEVAAGAAVFAAELGEDPRAGYTAGLAHDLFRGLPDKTVRAALRPTPIRLRQIEQDQPMLAHGAAAAAFLQKLTPPVPDKIRRAVRWHTFPRRRAGRLLQALILADALAPGRTSDTWVAIRSSAVSLPEKYELVREAKCARAVRKQQAVATGGWASR